MYWRITLTCAESRRVHTHTHTHTHTQTHTVSLSYVHAYLSISLKNIMSLVYTLIKKLIYTRIRTTNAHIKITLYAFQQSDKILKAKIYKFIKMTYSLGSSLLPPMTHLATALHFYTHTQTHTLLLRIHTSYLLIYNYTHTHFYIHCTLTNIY
jgi:hypothetical protein